MKELDSLREARYIERSERVGPGKFPCLVCGRGISLDRMRHRIAVHNGGLHIMTPAEAAAHPEQCDELGAFPIGPDCLSKHPELRAYVLPQPGERGGEGKAQLGRTLPLPGRVTAGSVHETSD